MEEEDNKKTIESENLVCGIVMPISEIDGLPESHWMDVYKIIEESIKAAGFMPNMVSNSDEVGIIQNNIVQNLYDNPIVVCDVSAKNPNVMFELGLRLAFDKPTIVIKDDKTSYTFDTSMIEHLEYRRDLRYSNMNMFKEKLTNKISKTYTKSKNDSNYSTFLKHFKNIKPASIDTEEVSKSDYIIKELGNIRSTMMQEIEKNRIFDHLNRNSVNNVDYNNPPKMNFYKDFVKLHSKINEDSLIRSLLNMDEVDNVKIIEKKEPNIQIEIDYSKSYHPDKARKKVNDFIYTNSYDYGTSISRI